MQFTVNDPQNRDGTINGPYAHFTVALDSGTVSSEGGTLELTEQEMVRMARILVGLMTAAEDYYNHLI